MRERSKAAGHRCFKTPVEFLETPQEFQTFFIHPGSCNVARTLVRDAIHGVSTGNYMRLPLAIAVFHPRKVELCGVRAMPAFILEGGEGVIC